MNRWMLGRVVAPAAFVAGGWLAATAAHGQQLHPESRSREIAALEARVKALEEWRAQAGVFTADANGNWSFAPASGDVSVKSTTVVTLTAGQTFVVKAGNTASIEAGSNATLSGAGQAIVKGTQVLLNASGGGNPAATVGSLVSSAGQVVTGSSTVLVGP
jgi:VCBS repeat-containing protein